MSNDTDDLISRRLAIKALKECINEVLKDLLSEQSGIIRCKDCDVHGICCFELGLGENGYCSQAQRRNENGNF